MLTHLDLSKSTLLYVDASPYKIGLVMAHKMKDGKEKLVCYISQTLSVAEHNYTHIEKEGLAQIFSQEIQSVYVKGILKTLLGLFSENKPIPPFMAIRIQKWTYSC